MFDDLTSILVDIDPHRSKQPALDRARKLARRTGAELHLFICDYVYALSEGLFFDNKKIEMARENYVDELRQWLDEQADALRNDGVKVTTKVAWRTSRYVAVLEHAKAVDAGLIIRAAAEHSKLDRLFVSATDWELIRRAAQPLWLVKKSGNAGESANILAALELAAQTGPKAELDRKLLKVAESLRIVFSGSLHLCHAYLPITTDVPVPAAPMLGAATAPVPRIDQDTIEEMKDYHRNSMQAHASSYIVAEDNIHLVAGDTAQMIQEVVDDHDIDIVVAGSVSRSWLDRILLGSTAEKLLDVVDCDIVVVKPEGFSAD